MIVPLVIALAASTSPSQPDLTNAKTIEDAANACQLTSVGVNWKAVDASTMEVRATAADLTTPSKGIAQLKACFFGWAYDHNVKLVVVNADEGAK